MTDNEYNKYTGCVVNIWWATAALSMLSAGTVGYVSSGSMILAILWGALAGLICTLVTVGGFLCALFGSIVLAVILDLLRGQVED